MAANRMAFTMSLFLNHQVGRNLLAVKSPYL
jgi:hypothetical protein